MLSGALSVGQAIQGRRAHTAPDSHTGKTPRAEARVGIRDDQPTVVSATRNDHVNERRNERSSRNTIGT